MLLGFLIFVVLLSGLVAYSADTIARKAGRKHLRLFGLRPKTTALIVAVASGMGISLASVLAFGLLNRAAIGNILQADQLRVQLQQLKQDVSATNQQLQQAQTERDQANQRAQAAAQATAQAQSSMQAAHTKLAQARAQVQQLQQRTRSLGELQRSLETQSRERQAQLSRSKAALELSEQRAATQQSRLSALSSELSSLNARAQATRARVQAQVSAAQQRAAQATNQAQQLEESRLKVQAQLSQTRGQLGQTQTQLEHVRAQQQRAAQQQKAALQARDAALAQQRQLARQNQQLSAQYKAAQQQLGAVQLQLASAAAQRNAVRQEVQGLKAAIASLDAQRSELSATNGTLQANLNSTRADLSRLEVSYSRASSELSANRNLELAYSRNDLVYAAPVSSVLSLPQFLASASAAAQKAGARGRPAAKLSPDLRVTLENKLRGINSNAFILCRAAVNAPTGFAVDLLCDARPQTTMYRKGDAVAQGHIDLQKGTDALSAQVIDLTRDAVLALTAKGVPPEYINNHGLSDTERLDLLGRLAAQSGPAAEVVLRPRSEVKLGVPVDLYAEVIGQ